MNNKLNAVDSDIGPLPPLEKTEAYTDIIDTVCRVCGSRVQIGAQMDDNGNFVEGEHLCAEHLFSKVILPEDVTNGRRLTSKKSVGETVL